MFGLFFFGFGFVFGLGPGRGVRLHGERRRWSKQRVVEQRAQQHLTGVWQILVVPPKTRESLRHPPCH